MPPYEPRSRCPCVPLPFSSGVKPATPYTLGTCTPRNRRSPNGTPEGHHTDATNTADRARRVSTAFQSKSSNSPRCIDAAMTTRHIKAILLTFAPSQNVQAVGANPAKIQNVRASFSDFFPTATEACAFRVTTLFSNTSFAHDSALAAAPRALASPSLPLPVPLALTFLRNCTS